MSRQRILAFHVTIFVLHPQQVLSKSTSAKLNLRSHFRSNAINEHTIYPYIHSFSNMTSSSTLLKGFQIPDVLPSSLPPGPSFSLVAGDFEEIYGVLPEGDEREPQQGKWDAVLTCFFIDTVSGNIHPKHRPES